MSKTIVTRIQNKTDSAEKWKDSTLVPLLGEMIVYTFSDGRAPQVKFGDGSSLPEDLPFSSADIKGIDTTTIDLLFS